MTRDSPDAPRRARLLTGAMLGIASGAILVPLNSTMLAVALPSVALDFDVGPSTVASLVTLYLGAVAIALPASGSLGDRFGHRRIFLVGVAAFGIASALAATAVTFEVLAASRVLQAVSGALVSTSSVALIRAAAPADRRGAAFGVFDMLVSTSAAVGPFVGGILVGSLGWRTLFVVAVPVALAAAIAVGVRGPGTGATGSAEPEAHPPRPIDLPGLGLLAAVLVAALLGLRALEDSGPGSLALLAVPPLLVAFVAWELRTDHPAVDPRLFREAPFAGAVLAVLGATVVLHATLVIVPLLVERLLDGDAWASGVVLLGISALGALAAPIGGRWSDSLGRRLPAVLGMLVAAGGLAALWRVAPEASVLLLAVLLSIVGFGMGLSGSARQTAAMESVGRDRVGMAAGTYLTGRYLGGALGATLAGAVLGGAVTPAGVTTGFGLLAAVAIAVAVASLALPSRRPV